MIKIILVRHGETTNNAENLTQGSGYDTPLTKKGIVQIQDKIDILKKLDLQIDQIITSTSARTESSAKLIKETLYPTKEIMFDKRLNAINWGEFTNKPLENTEVELEKFIKDINYNFVDGESFVDVRNRSMNFLAEIEKRFIGQTILIVGHAMVLKIMLILLKGLPLDKLTEHNMPNEYISELIIEGSQLIKSTLLVEDKNLICI